MLNNREFTIRTRRADRKKDEDGTCEEGVSFDEKVATAIMLTKTAAIHVAGGVCAYVLLDTFRQVQVAKHTNQSKD